MAAGDVVNTAARLQTAAPVDGILVGEPTYRATARRDRLPRGRAGGREGEAEPIRSGRRSARARASASRSSSGRAPLVGRARGARPAASSRWRACRRERSPQLVTLVGVPGIGKSRLVAELVAAVETGPRADLVAAGPLAAVRRRRDVLGARRDGEGAGRASSRPTGARGRGEARMRRPCTRSCPDEARRAGSSRTCGRSSASRPATAGRETAGARRSRPGAASWRRWPTGARSCSSSRTCTGPTTRCSTSSTSSSTAPSACRCSSSPRRAPTSSSGGPTGAAASATRRRSRSRRSRDADTAGCSAAARAARCCRPRRRRSCSGARGGVPLCAEEYVRMLEDRGLLVRAGHWQLGDDGCRCRRRCRGSSPRASTR